MTGFSARDVLLRKLRRARILVETARDLHAVADECFADAQRLVDEIHALRSGEPALVELPRQLPPAALPFARRPVPAARARQPELPRP